MNKYPDFTNYGYQIIKELGRNLQGGRITYLATSLTSNQQVVIKEFRFALADGSWSAFKAYQREISVLQQLKHPHIPGYLDSFETESGFGLVTEYISAPSLAERYIFTPQEVKQIATSVLEVLRYLQNFQPPIIHRDIKPENILVDENLQVYLVDFGLAKLRSGELALSSIAAGTPGFMPPEEMFNRPLTTASDLYSLGATLICLLTETRSVEVDKLLDEDYRFKFKDLIPNLDLRFGKWLTKMVEPHPKRRYENAVLALQELKGIPVVRGEESLAFPKNEVEVDGNFVDREIPVVGAREIFAFPEGEVEVIQKFIGVADKGEIVFNSRGEIKDNKKVFGVVDKGEIFAIGRGILKDKKKFVGALGIVAIIGIFAGKIIISLGSKNINLAEQTQVNKTSENHPYAISTISNSISELFTPNICFDDNKCIASNINQLQNIGECIKCDLTGANLENTNLENASLQGALLENANLQNTNLQNANLTLTNLRNTSINDQTILNPKWRLVWQIVNNKYQDLNLKIADLSGAFLGGVNLENVDLEGANLENTNLSDSILVGANLKSANLKGARINSYNYMGDKSQSQAQLQQVNLENANLENAQLIHSRLQYANLEGANLRKSYLFGAHLENTNLKGANLENSLLESSYLQKANLENANLKNANLKNADLTGANIKGADFIGANLEGATMPDGSIYNGKIDK
ncbi:MAG: serine/threonine-protein kinase [Microcoleaceae cyanobacterium MO_207.B10]|nr:serine/threonine-protein kinase [Microcoleaceae cyanobacterium MO_207.B10]